MYVSLKGFAATIAVIGMAVTASAQGRRPFDVPPARTASQAGGTLTPPSNASPVAVIAQYLRDHGRDDTTARSIVEISRGSVRNGVMAGRYAQRADGMPVYGTYAKASFNDRGELVYLVENLVSVPGAVARASVGAQQAIDAAVRYLYPDLVSVPAGFFRRAPTASGVAVPESDGSLSAGYLVETWTASGNQLHETLVGGDGAILDDESRTSDDRYNVFVKNPSSTPQSLQDGAGAGNAQSPSGWLAGDQATTYIHGNNANAYLDTNADNQIDSATTPVANGDFLTTANLTTSPSTTQNRAVAVQNLFYLNNVMHDTLYTYGFDEAAGNFQANNFGHGGLGSDPVNAEAQDGSGTDNANFATPADGSSPRMQMYLWTGVGTHQVVVNGTTFAAQGAQFGAVLTTTGVTGVLALVNDGAAPTSDACTALPAGSMNGKVALIDRGTCDFVTKVANAQKAGAIAAIIANNAGDSIFTMGGSSRTISIPSVMVGQTDGATLKTKVGLSATERKAATPPLQHDGDVDSDVVFHEYCHGLTWRMIGRMDGPIAGAIGEGMSDTCALLLNGDDRIGEYSASDSAGIRRYPYTNYPLRYKDMNSGEVHNDGELYGAIGWLLMSDANLFAGPRVPELFEYIVQGMHYTPERPTYEQMRDGILQAVTVAGNPNGDACRVWTAFAHYGVGVGAKATVKGTKVTITQSFTLPAECQ